MIDVIKIKHFEHHCNKCPEGVGICHGGDNVWQAEDKKDGAIIEKVTYCPFCGQNLEELNKVKCKNTSKDCAMCRGTGWKKKKEGKLITTFMTLLKTKQEKENGDQKDTSKTDDSDS